MAEASSIRVRAGFSEPDPILAMLDRLLARTTEVARMLTPARSSPSKDPPPSTRGTPQED